MSRQKIKVIFADGKETEAKITPRAEVMFEQHYEVGLPSLENNPHAEYVYYLAWCSCVDSKMYHENFDTFLDSLEDVEMLEDPKDDGIDDPTSKDLPSEPLSS